MKEILSFFFGEFHEGWINRLLHVVGLAFFIIGVWEINWVFIIGGILCMESGHAFHFFTHFKGKYPVNIKRLALTQFVISILAFVFTAVLISILKLMIKPI